MQPIHLTFVAAVLIAAPGLVQAKEPAPPPAVFQAVIDCRVEPDPDKRLACFDRAVDAMAAASKDRELLVTDRPAMREARQELFGYAVPDATPLLGDDAVNAEDRIDSITAKIARAALDPRGRVVLTLEGGARWQQIDGETIPAPRVGQSVTIRKAALGSFLAKVEKGRAFRVRRIGD